MCATWPLLSSSFPSIFIRRIPNHQKLGFLILVANLMDESEERKSKPSLLDRILPPRLEDAGLEDCALPPDSIREAFYKAASAVKSRATALVYSDDDDDSDGYDVEKELKLPEFGRDEVVVGGMEERRGKGCVVDVLEGLEIGEEAKKKKKKKSGEEEKPILAEGFA